MKKKNISTFLSLVILCGLFLTCIPERVDASTTQSVTIIAADYSNASAFGSGIYSRSSTQTVNKTITLSNVDTATLNVGSTSYPCIATATTVTCSGSMTVNGVSNSVSGQEHYIVNNGRFDWWRNNNGAFHPYWWSADYGGATVYADNNIGGCGSAPCDDPGTASRTWNYTDGSTLNASSDVYAVGSDNLNYSVVNGVGWEQVSISGAFTSAIVGPISGGISNIISVKGGPFGPVQTCGGSPYKCFYPITYSVKLDGITYSYATSATLDYTLLPGATPAPTTAPTPTPVGATPTPTPVATPTPPPTCSTPVTISAIIPSTTKAGQDFYVSGSGSKDSSGGTNLSYQWYYQNNSSGGLVTGASTQNAIMNLSVQGSYKIYLGITDNSKPICTASTYQNVTVTAPGPDAVITVSGRLKEGRRVRLDASNSDAPTAYPIDHSGDVWTIDPVPGETAGTTSDIQYLGSLTGKLKDFKTSKKGNYKVTLTVHNAFGSSTATKILAIDPDLPPVGEMTGAQTTYRSPDDPDHPFWASILVHVDVYSPDGDIVAKRVFSFVYDSNNDGVYDEPKIYFSIEDDLTINQEKIFTDSNGHKFYITWQPGDYLLIKAAGVGKYQIQLVVAESPADPTTLEY
jgi:hypothetical protein